MLKQHGFGGLDTSVCWDVYKLVAPYIPSRNADDIPPTGDVTPQNEEVLETEEL